MTFSFGTLVSNEKILKTHLLTSQLPKDTKISYVKNSTNASKGLNILLEKFYNDGADIGIFLHQDVVVSKDWLSQVENQTKKFSDNWLLAGVWGRTLDGYYHGCVFDTRFPDPWETDDIFPMEVDCLDGVCLIFNLKYKIDLSNDLKGWDPYDTYVCMLAKSLGLKVYVIKASLNHYCTRSIRWKPDEEFFENIEILKKRFPDQEVCSTIWSND